MSNETGLEYILGGGPIFEFQGNVLPTNCDVLRFYSQHWRKKQTDSKKQAHVAKALEDLYCTKRIATICNTVIRRKVKRQVGKLKQILKFRSKTKTINQIQLENEFKSSLTETFPIENFGNAQTPAEDTAMEINEQNENGIIFRCANNIDSCIVLYILKNFTYRSY